MPSRNESGPNGAGKGIYSVEERIRQHRVYESARIPRRLRKVILYAIVAAGCLFGFDQVLRITNTGSLEGLKNELLTELGLAEARPWTEADRDPNAPVGAPVPNSDNCPIEAIICIPVGD